MSSPLPPEVAEALRRGNAIEAMKLMRKANPRMGLAEARNLLEAIKKIAPKPPAAPVGKVSYTSAAHKHSTPMIHRRSGLSPGEVPRSSDAAGAMALLIVAVLAALLYMGFG